MLGVRCLRAAGKEVVTVWRLVQAIWTLLVQFWHEKTGKLKSSAPDASAMPSPTPLPDTQDAKTAIHEAGHMVAAWFCTFIDDVKSARIAATGGTVEYTVIDTEFAPVMWCRMVIALAGVAAEARVFKRWRSIEARDDLRRARELSAYVVGTTPPWKALESKRHLVEAAYTPALSENEAEAIRHAYAMARLLVEKHEIRLYRCAGLLLHRRTLTSADLTAAFGRRAFIRVASITRGFWMP